jgi:Asp/Glu/hydantoin racemase
VVSIPALKVDEPMVNKAISMGKRIGVAATAPTTLKPTTDLVYARAAELGKEVQVDPLLSQEAYAAMFAGDLAAHDRLVLDMLRQLMSRNDVVLLAQASMARLADQIPEAERTAPLLSSPRLAVEHLRAIIGS